jgi:Flp pilus assembly protein TadD
MTHHRIIWYITGAFVIVSALILLVREGCDDSSESTHSPIPQPTETQRQDIDTMIKCLKADPYAVQSQTRAAIDRAARLAGQGTLATSETCYALGLRALDEKRYTDAEAAFRKAVALRPGWSWPHNALGVLLANYTKDRTAEAEAAYRSAIRLEPGWSRPYNDLAILLRLAGRLAEAEEAALTAIRLDPGSVATHNNYGNLLVTQRRLPEAEAQYRKAIELDRGHPKPYYNLACVCSLQNRVKEALSLLAQAIRLDPELRQDAQRDPDLAPLRNNPEFQRLAKPN